MILYQVAGFGSQGALNVIIRFSVYNLNKEYVCYIKVIIQNASAVETNAMTVFYFQEQENLPKTLETIDAELGGTIKQLIETGEIKGKVGEVTVIHSMGKVVPQRIVVCGLGKKGDLKPDVLRQAASSVCKTLGKKGVKDIAFEISEDELIGMSAPVVAQLAEGAELGARSFTKYFTSPDDGMN